MGERGGRVTVNAEELLCSPLAAELVADLKLARWTGRPGYPLRAMVGLTLVKAVYGVPTWTGTIRFVAAHRELRAMFDCRELPSEWACYRFAKRLVEIASLPEKDRRRQRKAHKMRMIESAYRRSIAAPVRLDAPIGNSELTVGHSVAAGDSSDPHAAAVAGLLDSLVGDLSFTDIERLDEQSLGRLQDRLREAGFAPRGIRTRERLEQRRLGGEPRAKRAPRGWKGDDLGKYVADADAEQMWQNDAAARSRGRNRRRKEIRRFARGSRTHVGGKQASGRQPSEPNPHE